MFASAQAAQPISVQQKLAQLEASFGGKLGVAAINTANHMQVQYHAAQRFPIGCTSKVMGVAAILKMSMADPALLQQKLTYTKADLALASWTPITQKHLTDGMTVAELSAAAISYSDNAAMNTLIKKMGGLKTVNAFARSIGDNTFRVDHWYPAEASVTPGSLDDTTTPAAMAKSVQQLVLGSVLATPQRELLQTWLKNTTTGDSRIRAGVPKGWVVGDKTGTSNYGTTNDVAVIWPPKCAPIVIAVYSTQQKKDATHQDAILAAATRIVLEEFARTDPKIPLKST